MKVKMLDVVAGIVCALAAVLWSVAYADEGLSKDGKNIVVTGQNVEVEIDETELQVEVENGASAVILPSPYEVTVHSSGGTVALCGSETESWKTKVGFWLDASATDTLEQFGTYTTTDGCKEIVRWYDCRPDHRTWRGYNNRIVGDAGTHYTLPYVVPEGGPNNMPYVSLGKYDSSRRMPFITVDEQGKELDGGSKGSAPPSAMPSKWVVMVFGSINGGCSGVLGSLPAGHFTATNSPDPDKPNSLIFRGQNPHTLYVDGIKCDCTTTPMNGGWQILSFDADDDVAGIGWLLWCSYLGGQSYAEIIVFDQLPTFPERIACERYLADKYDLPYRLANGEVRLFGTGAASITNGAVRLGGEFAGTVEISPDSAIVSVDRKLAPTAPSGVTADGTATDVIWFNPDREDLATYLTMNGAAAENHSLNVMKNAANHNYHPICGGGRGAYWVEDARGFATTAHKWYEYRISQSGGSSVPGNTLRFDNEYDGTGHTFDTQMGFFVLDTTKGGGTPFMETSLYSSSTQYLDSRWNKDSMIFQPRTDAGAFVTNAVTTLNGIAVDPGRHKFNSRPELLAFAFSQRVPVKCIGNYTQGTDGFELRHGEFLLYANALTDAQRQDTEAYLMKKWLGITPAGYGSPSAMTIAGAGTVKLANHEGAKPAFAAAFAGTVGAASGALTFTVAKGTTTAVVDPLELGAGTFDAGEALTVNVKLDGSVPAGRYKLVSAAAWTGAEPTLGTVEKTIRARRFCTLERIGGDLYLNVEVSGMLLFVR